MLKPFFATLCCNRKSFKIIALFLLSPLFFYGQTLTGLWTGSLSNDSTTVRKDQSFEIALTEYKGKVYGYSRSEFIVDDVLYFIVKRVKGTIEGDICEVTDDEIISYNFPKKLDKNIKVTSTFRRDKGDSVWHLDGKWKTNATKKYYSVSGKVALEVEKDLTASKIFPHLEELKLANDIAFYKERKEGQPIVRIAKPEKADPVYTEKINLEKEVSSSTSAILQKAQPAIVATQPSLNNTKEETRANAIEKNKTEAIAEKELAAASTKANNNPSTVADKKEIKTQAVVSNPQTMDAGKPDLAINNPSIKNNTVAVEPKNTPKENTITTTTAKQEVVATVTPSNLPKQTTTSTKPAVKNNDAIAAKTDLPITNNSVANNKEVKNVPVTIKPAQTVTTKQTEPTNSIAKTPTPVTSIEKKEVLVSPALPETRRPSADITLKAALIAGRKSEFSQVVNFKSDSLQISLYDNGEIDGDTVSVFMNGEVLLSKQGLKSSAIRKTIYLTPGQDEEFTLVMFAESLGKYPPNTGLLVIHDGNDVYNLRFSSDFQKNAGIVFKRKR